ncbi:MAG TPA: hypothetical protein VIK83_02055, partial [Coriobacteriia bacterium]
MIACAAALLLLATGLPSTASAKSSAAIRKALAAKQAQAARAETQLSSVREQLTNALQAQSDADLSLEGAREELATTAEAINQLNAQIDERQGVLDDRAVSMYTSGGTDMLAALLSVSTLDDLFTRIDLFSYIQQSDTELVAAL